MSLDEAAKLAAAQREREEQAKSEQQRRDEKLAALSVEAAQAQELGASIVGYAASGLSTLSAEQQAFIKKTCGDTAAEGLGAQAKVAIAQAQLNMVQAFRAHPGALGTAPAGNAPAADQPGAAPPAAGTPPAAPQQIPAPTSTTAAPVTTAATPPAENSPDWHYAQWEMLDKKMPLAATTYMKRNRAAIESSQGWRNRYPNST